MENFPWTRLDGIALPDAQKAKTDLSVLERGNPESIRQLLVDGNMGGVYQRPDEEMLAIWQVAIEETLALLEGGWN